MNSKMAWKDVFESDLCLPERVCILAPGPNGAGHYEEIPADCSIIAVSKAVLIPRRQPSIWMMNHVHQPWYRAANRLFHGIRVFKHDAAKAAEQIRSTNESSEGQHFFFMPPAEPLGLEKFVPVDGCIRIGATISACAVQLAYNLGARAIVLCGVDMSGDGYFDGTVNTNPNHGDTWPAATRLNVLIDWLTVHRGLRFTTVSPTKLNVPFHDQRSHLSFDRLHHRQKAD